MAAGLPLFLNLEAHIPPNSLAPLPPRLSRTATSAIRRGLRCIFHDFLRNALTPLYFLSLPDLIEYLIIFIGLILAHNARENLLVMLLLLLLERLLVTPIFKSEFQGISHLSWGLARILKQPLHATVETHLFGIQAGGLLFLVAIVHLLLLQEEKRLPEQRVPQLRRLQSIILPRRPVGLQGRTEEAGTSRRNHIIDLDVQVHWRRRRPQYVQLLDQVERLSVPLRVFLERLVQDQGLLLL